MPIVAGSLVWIENPYGSTASLLARETVGPVDDDPKSKYREGWCPSTYSERPVYVPGVVKDVDQDGTITIMTALEPSITLTRSVNDKILMRSNTSGDGVNDCLNVENDNIAEIMWMLMKRYIRDQPYTMCGPNVIVSVNPSKPIVLGKLVGSSDPWASLRGELLRIDRTIGNRHCDVFDYAVQRVYTKISQTNLPPHLYSVAKIAMDNITKKRIKSQIMICSGIPGSGKTTAAKAIIDYAITASSHRAFSSRSRAPDYTQNVFDMTGLTKIERQVLHAQSILEAFGHCATERNSNSSRLGKMTKLYFPPGASSDDETPVAARIVCAQIETALLDRGRLLKFPMLPGEERNFNIFYQLLVGYDQLKSLPLVECTDLLFGVDVNFVGLDSKVEDHKVHGVNDLEAFARLKEALTEFEFTEDEQIEIFNVVSGILAFSKVSFMGYKDEKEKVSLSVVHDSTRAYLKLAASFWGVTEDTLEETMCSRLKNDKSFVPIDTEMANRKKAMLLKSMYGSLVNYITSRMNKTMLEGAPSGFKIHESNFLGVVDMFGVDCQPKDFNSLEQLLMNYTAEKIHQITVQKIFKEEQDLCRQEGIAVGDTSCPDNIRVLEFFDKRATGLLSSLTTDCRFDRVTDTASLQTFVRGRKQDSDIWSLPKFEDYVHEEDGEQERAKERALCKLSLVVKHYTQDKVRYNFDGFLNTNKYFYAFEGKLGAPLHECLPLSTNSVLRDGVVPLMNLGGMTGRHDLVSKYKRNMQERILTRGLMIGGSGNGGVSYAGNDITDSSFFDLHYVFCVRPNLSSAMTNHASPYFMKQQIDSMGIPAIVRHRHQGFVYKKDYLTFIQRFLPIVANNEFLCLTAASSSPVTKKALSYELLRVMLQMVGMYIEEETSNFEMGETRIFIRFKMFSVLNKLREDWDKKCYESVVKIQHTWHQYLASQRFREMQIGVSRIQTSFRSSLSSAKWTAKDRAISAIDNAVKNHFVRSYFMDRRVAARKCQKYFRIKKQRMKWLRVRRGIRVMHSLARGFVVRQHVLRMLRAVRTIQRAVRGGAVRFHEYWDKVRCCLAIQCAHRGKQWRREHSDVIEFLSTQSRKRKMGDASRLLGSMFKTVLIRRRYRDMREACMCIQHWCRAVDVRNRFVKARMASNMAQRLVKGFMARRGMEKMRTHNMVRDELFALQVVRERERDQVENMKALRKAQRGRSKASIRYDLLDVDTMVNTKSFYPDGWARSFGSHEIRMNESGSHTTQICVGASHSAVLNDRGQVFTWGWADYGQLGHGTAENESTPRCVTSLLGGGQLGSGIFIRQIACGEDHTIALSQNGRMYSWGSNLRGQLGVGDLSPDQRALYSPCLIGKIKRRVAQVKCGAFHSVALLSSGSLYTWGSGAQLGLGVFTGRGDRSIPTNVKKLVRFRVRQISCGPSFTACVTHGGDVYTWGVGNEGQLGMGDRKSRYTPMLVKALSGKSDPHKHISSIACGGHHCVALSSTGKLFTWGSSVSGNENVGCLGLGDSITEALEPRFVQSMRVRRVVQLACGWRMTIAITDDHRIFAWGLIGSLVNGTSISGLYEKDTTHVISTSPCEINNFEKSTSIACFVDVSFSHTLSATGIILRNKALKSSSSPKASPASTVSGSHAVRNLEQAVAKSPKLAKVSAKFSAFKKVKNLIREYGGAIVTGDMDNDAGWITLVCHRSDQAQHVYTQRTGQTDVWSLAREVETRGLEIIRNDSETSGGAQIVVVALVPVEKMNAKQLRSVVMNLQIGEDRGEEQKNDPRESGWKSFKSSAKKSTPDKSAYTPKMYRSPISSSSKKRSGRRRSTLLEESRLRGEMLEDERDEPPVPLASDVLSPGSKIYRLNRRAQQQGSEAKRSMSMQMRNTRKVRSAERAMERSREEKPEMYVNWSNFQHFFDDNELAKTSQEPRMKIDRGSKFRGLTVNEIIDRTSSAPRKPLFTEQDRKPLRGSARKFQDSMMRGSSAWSGIASVANMSEEEKRRVLGKSYHSPGNMSIPPPPPQTPDVPDLKGTQDLESKISVLRRQLDAARSGGDADGSDVRGVIRQIERNYS